MVTGPDILNVVLLFFLHNIHSESAKFEVLGPTKSIVAEAGDDIILPCYLKPHISAEDMTVDWLKLDILDERVYRYQNGKNILEDQIPYYRDRTSLFKEELWRGNTSLKLTRVQLTDQGLYECLIRSQSWYDDTKMQVIVKAVGSRPVVSIEGHRDGGMGLLCESEGWHPEPELVWLDSKGVSLSVRRSETHRDLNGFYTVRQQVIVQKTDTNHFTCRVLQRQINVEVETEVHVPSEWFDYTSPWRRSFIVLCSLGVITVIGLSLAVYCTFRKKDEHIADLKQQHDENMAHLKQQHDENMAHLKQQHDEHIDHLKQQHVFESIRRHAGGCEPITEAVADPEDMPLQEPAAKFITKKQPSKKVKNKTGGVIQLLIEAVLILPWLHPSSRLSAATS